MATIYMPKSTTDLGTLASLNTNDLVIAEGNQQVTTGLDQSALAAAIANVYWQPGAGVQFLGGGGEFLKCSITGMMFLKGNSGVLNYTPVGTGSTTTCARIKQIGGVKLNIGGGGTVIQLEQSSGSTFISDSSNVTNIWQDGGYIEQLYKATANTTATLSGGEFYSGRGITTANIGGSARVTIKREDTSATLPFIANLNLSGDGGLYYCGDSTGSSTAWFCYGDSWIDVSDVPKAITIDSLTITKNCLRHPKTRLKGKNFTVTINTLVVRGDDGDIIVA